MVPRCCVRGPTTGAQACNRDIRGGNQRILFLTHSSRRTLLVGSLSAEWNFRLYSQLLNGELKVNGWTAGGYLVWRLIPGVRSKLAGPISGISYTGGRYPRLLAFPAAMLEASPGGHHNTARGFELENSARVLRVVGARRRLYGHASGAMQTDRNFSIRPAPAPAARRLL